MRIALDYDDTYTKDPTLWDNFVTKAKYNGHQISFVTYRYPYETKGIVDAAKRLALNIVFTSRQPKRRFFNADVWIDDMPECIVDTDHMQGKKFVLTLKDPELNRVEPVSGGFNTQNDIGGEPGFGQSS